VITDEEYISWSLVKKKSDIRGKKYQCLSRILSNRVSLYQWKNSNPFVSNNSYSEGTKCISFVAFLSKSLKPNALPFECVLTKPMKNILQTLSCKGKNALIISIPLTVVFQRCSLHKFHMSLVCVHHPKWWQILGIMTKVWIPRNTKLRKVPLPQWPLQCSISLLNLVWSSHNLKCLSSHGEKAS